MNYRLQDQQFLTVRYLSGKREKLNLIQVLKDAHLIKKLEYPYPVKTEMYAIYRFLTQLSTDILRPADADAIYAAYEKRKFDGEKIDAYFEKYGSRFNLFDPVHPFMQAIPADFENYKKSSYDINIISPLIRQGNNDVFYNPIKHLKKEMEWDIEHVVGNLLFNNFCHLRTGSGYKAPIMGGSGTTPLFVLHEGGNLFETIILEMDSVTDTDIPYWRREKYGEVYDFTLMNYEFYPVMKFHYDEMDYDNGLFSKIHFEADNKHELFKLDKDKQLESIKNTLQLKHPGTIKRGDAESQYPEKAYTTRENWLSLGLLYESRKFNDIIGWQAAEIMYEEGTLPKTLNISYFGVNKGQSGVFKNIYESMDNIPSNVVFNADKQKDINMVIDYIERAANRLKWVSTKYASEVLNENKASRMFEQITSVFYQRARNKFFTEFLKDKDAKAEEFSKEISKECMNVYCSLPTIRDDVIAKKSNERALYNALTKEMEKIYGKHETQSA